MKKVLLVIILSFFTFFVILMVAESQGYYKTRSEKAKELTEEQIKEFEKDIDLGRDIDVKKYVLYEDKDYTNKLSNTVYKISLKLESIFDKTIKLIFNGAASAVND